MASNLSLVPPTHSAGNEQRVPYQPAALDIWSKKYQLVSKAGEVVDQTMDDTFQRVARALADIEQGDEMRDHWYKQFLWALRRGAIPAGRILSNAGAQQYKPKTSTINCTVSGIIEDSMDGILTRVHEAGLTLKTGSGIGYCFSTLRPRGSFVDGAGATTSGPLSFMEIYDRMCQTISSAGGRRGAQMATFDIGHPDVMDFIRAKREDGRLRQFNLSLLITQEFMEAVQTDGEWKLAFPIGRREAEQGDIDFLDPEQVVWRNWVTTERYVTDIEGRTACKVYKTIRARRLWDMIMSSTYDFAEPGFILIDKVNEMNNNWFCEDIQASNPCVTADTWVHTSEGPRQVADLVGRAFTARVNGRDYTSGSEGFFVTAEKPVIRIITCEGQSLRLTADHRVLRASERRATGAVEWVEAGSLKPGDAVVAHNHRDNVVWAGSGSDAEGYLIGMLLGDGYIGETMGAILCCWSESAQAANGGTVDSPVMKAVSHAVSEALTVGPTSKGWHKVNGRNEYRLHSRALAALAEEYGMVVGNEHVDERIEQTSSDFHTAFLRGLFDADGSVQGTQRKGVSIRLAQSDRTLLERVQRMLLRLGVTSAIYAQHGRSGLKDYSTRAKHELMISGESLAVYQERIGFCDEAKAERLKVALSNYRRGLNADRFVFTVESLQDEGVEPVYDVQVPGPNGFDANGLYVHNCGEQMLPANGACLLGSVNLTRFVRNPFTESASFDWDEFCKVVGVFTRMLDNVVEINGLPLDAQREEIQRKRRHGMGFLGLGSTLTMLRMPYGSPESVNFTDQVSRELALAGWRAGLELAKEKGSAPIMEEEFEVTTDMLRKYPKLKDDGYQMGDRIKGKVLHAKYSRYMQRIAEADPELVQALMETGSRFTHHSSIAPTGTTSLSLANNASNGIEPSFAHRYFRNVIRNGRKTKEKVTVYSFELLAYRALIDSDATPEAGLPDYFITADDVTPIQHVDIQAAAQKWVDSSISKTANVPTDYPYEDFKDIYRYAYQKGLKGCTTFRFNPETFQGVLVKEQDLKNTTYDFTLDDGSVVSLKGDEEIEYDGETHTAANLYDALKEGYFGRLG